MIRAAFAVLSVATLAAPAVGQAPLFTADEPLRIEIRGPISTLVKGSRDRSRAHQARLTLAGMDASHAIRLSPRGITRLKRETCTFPPLRVDFAPAPSAPSPFAGQGRLKLVTHCQGSAGFQQHVLLEYAAYRLYNLMTPASFRVRLANIDYVDDDGRAVASRVGFFIEERDDVGRRIGLGPARTGDRVVMGRLDPAAAARVALFQYMIGNLDWSMRAGPPGEGCCHNSRLFVAAGASANGANLVSVPYDFDYSGLVDAPYAVPPDGSDTSVRKRDYQGYCHHNSQARAAAADIRGKRPALLAEIGRIPGLDSRSQRKAIGYLDQFFADISTDERLAEKVLKSCVR